MNVLFAVNNDKISDAIVKRYQKEYKEIISFKNVYYFNAILKELQVNKSYDRIVISEDLEPFANNNYDTIDKFLFEKLDRISDEATKANGEDIEIILICSDRRTASDEMLTRIFGIGIYNALIGDDRSIDNLCKLMYQPRNKKEAKTIYKINGNNVGYQAESENNVSESEVQNILAHYKRLGKDEDKYVDSFNNIVSQYTDSQLKIIIRYLPLNVKAVLEERSPKYQELSTFSGNTSKKTENGKYTPKTSKSQKEEEKIRVKMLKDEQRTINKPILIPTTLSKKMIKLVEEDSDSTDDLIETDAIEEQKEVTKEPIYQEKIEPEYNEKLTHDEESLFDEEPMVGNEQVIDNEPAADTKQNFEADLNLDFTESEKDADNLDTELLDQLDTQLQEMTKKGRGRPRKNVVPEDIQDKPKRGRGRPRKNVEVEPQEEQETQNEKDEELDLFDLGNEEDNSNSEDSDLDLFSLSNDNTDNLTEPSFEESETDESIDDLDLFNINESEETDSDIDFSGLDDNEDTNSDIDSTNLDDDDKLNLDDEDVDLFNINEEDDDNATTESDQEEENEDNDFDFFDIAEEDEHESTDNKDSFEDIENDMEDSTKLFDIEEDKTSNTEGNTENEHTTDSDIEPVYKPQNNLSTILTSKKKIVAFVGTTKNGTSFVVNNLALLLSSMNISTAILDTTQSKNAYYIFTKNEDSLRNIAENSITNLEQGNAKGIEVNKNLTVYTELPGKNNEHQNVENILVTLMEKHDVVLIDSDFDTNAEYFDNAQEIYLVQSMDILTIQPLTAFLRNLKSKGILKQEKVKIIINKWQKVGKLTDKVLIGGMSSYNDPSMTFMTELFNKDNVQYEKIPFEVQNSIKYLEALVDCEISLRGYTKQFIQALSDIANMVYPLVNPPKYSPLSSKKNRMQFSNETQSTLDKMKNNY